MEEASCCNRLHPLHAQDATPSRPPSSLPTSWSWQCSKSAHCILLTGNKLIHPISHQPLWPLFGTHFIVTQILIDRPQPSKPSLRRQQVLVFRSLSNSSALLTSLLASFPVLLSISGRAPGRIQSVGRANYSASRVPSYFFSWLDRKFPSPLPRDAVSRRSLCRPFFPRDQGKAFESTLKLFLLLFFVFFPFVKV